MGPAPQTHLPAVQAFAVKLHAAHAAPFVPHAANVGVVQTVPWQQPLGQLVLSQVEVQVPLMQLWLLVQLAPVPQAQAPVALHASLVFGSQLRHCAPLTPHAVGVGTVQVLFAQHPVGQFVEVQVEATQLPLTHRWLLAHGGLVPHWQAPETHASELAGSHIAQTEPAAPQLDSEGLATQLPALQHPVAQAVASQTHVPPTQRVPTPHAGPVPQAHAPFAHALVVTGSHDLQAAPLDPHVVRDEVEQVRPEQQPVGQDVASQTHVPPLQRCPVAQAGPAPHLQLPPAAQVSALVALQTRQTEPPEPHDVVDAPMHVGPLQQPAGQLTPSQGPPVHTPPTQA